MFVIDELDRCRPDFALEVLEKVKHLFSVTGITFLLVANKRQLENSVRARYGDGVDANNYLHKFVAAWVSLPTRTGRNSDKVAYLNYALAGMTDKEEFAIIRGKPIAEVLEEIVTLYQISFREIEKMLSYLAIAFNAMDETLPGWHHQVLISFFCFLKACRPDALDALLSKSDFKKVLDATGLHDLPKTDDQSTYYLHQVRSLIKYDLTDASTREKMIQDKEVDFGHLYRFPDNFSAVAYNWLLNMDVR